MLNWKKSTDSPWGPNLPAADYDGQVPGFRPQIPLDCSCRAITTWQTNQAALSPGCNPQSDAGFQPAWPRPVSSFPASRTPVKKPFCSRISWSTFFAVNSAISSREDSQTPSPSPSNVASRSTARAPVSRSAIGGISVRKSLADRNGALQPVYRYAQRSVLWVLPPKRDVLFFGRPPVNLVLTCIFDPVKPHRDSRYEE